MSYEFEFRTYFSFQHLKSAAIFCKQSYEIERFYAEKFSEIDSDERGKLEGESYAFVTGTIFTCISFLEADINEFYKDAADRSYNNRLYPLPEESIKALGELWNDKDSKFDMSSTLIKYQTALETAGKSKLSEGQEPYQSVKLLISLRNSLIHYKTETLKSSAFDPDSKHYFEKRLTRKFEQNLFYKYSGNPYFPNKCLGYGCAKWALASVINFAEEFYGEIGIRPSFEHIKKCIDIGNLKDISHESLEGSYRPVNQLQNTADFNREVISVVPEISIDFIDIKDLKELKSDT